MMWKNYRLRASPPNLLSGGEEVSALEYIQKFDLPHQRFALHPSCIADDVEELPQGIILLHRSLSFRREREGEATIMKLNPSKTEGFFIDEKLFKYIDSYQKPGLCCIVHLMPNA